MGLTLKERKPIYREVAKRYQDAKKKDKKKITDCQRRLNEFRKNKWLSEQDFDEKFQVHFNSEATI